MRDQHDMLVVRRRHAGPGLAVVTVSGEVDLLTAPRLRRALDRTHEPTTVVDLAGVTSWPRPA
jgi:anti-anti-sigma regulatory factor